MKERLRPSPTQKFTVICLETALKAIALYDKINEIEITLRYDTVTKEIFIEHPTEEIVFHRTWWSGWFEFYPKTEAYRQ